MKNIFYFYKIVVSITIFFFIPQLNNATQSSFSGNITGSVFWITDTVNITGDVTVTSTGSLNIASGIKVIFQGQYSIIVQGSITAVGLVTFSGVGKFRIPIFHYIYFTYKKINPTASDTSGFSNPAISAVGWKGITLQAGSTANFTRCQFLFAKSLTGCLFTNQGNAKFSSCIFHDNKIFNSSLCAILYSSPVNANDSLILSSSSLYKNYSGATIYASQKFSITGNSIYNNTNTNATNINDKSALSVTEGVGTITSNRVYNNSQNGVNITWTTSVTLDRNYIYNNKNYGIYLQYSIITLTNNLIVNNIIAGYIKGTITAFINNTIAYNQAGIGFQKAPLAGGSDSYLYNNIIWNNNSLDLSGDMNLYVNNCLLPYSSSSLRTLGFTVKSFKSNLNSDPLFKSPTDSIGWNSNASTADWSVGNNSPCINVGTTNTDPYFMPTTDYYGTPRIKHGFPDLGAYELFIPVDSITTSTITTPTLWVGDTIKVFNNVTVSTGGKLTIAPGTVISFQGDYFLEGADCSGIIAKGTDGDSIVFTRQDPIVPISSTQGIFWQGINIQTFHFSTDSAIFQYCRFEFAEHKGGWKGAAINVDFNDNVSIKNSLFRFNISRDAGNLTLLTGSGAAIAAFNSDVSVDQCQFTDNLAANTVFINSSNVNLSNCYFTRNMNDLSFSYSVKPLIINTITRSKNIINSSNPVFLNCEFYGTGPINLYSSNPRFYNSVCFTYVIWADQSYPTFFNCMFKSSNYGTLAGLTVNPYLPIVPFISNFVWDEGNNNYSLKDYRRNSFYPSINKGTSNLPSGVGLPSFDIQGNPRTNSDTVDLGAIEQQGQLPIINRQPFGNILCEGKSFSVGLINVDTAIYQWQKDGINIPDATNSTYSNASIDINSTGGYQCILRNAYGTIISSSALLQVQTTPTITDQPSSALIDKNSPFTLIAKADGSKPLRHIWFRDGEELSDTTFKLSRDSFKAEDEGTYVCEMTNACGSINTDPAVLSFTPSICMVTVFRPNKFVQGHNRIVWEKESKIQYSKYIIYRESSVEGYYDSIGSVPYTKLSVFDDTIADPKAQAYLYKITAVDTNGIETDINSCQLHKTIHLLVTRGEMGGIQLDWDQYIGLQYSTYLIYRRTNGGDFSCVHTMASSTRTWTDNTIVGPNDTMYYYVSVLNPKGCNPIGNKKAGSDIYSQSVSNMEDNRIQSTGVAKTNINNEFNLSCYPNPSRNMTTISYNLQKTSNVTIELSNMLGEKFAILTNAKQQAGYNNILLSISKYKLTSGVYMIQLKVGNSISTKQLVVMK
jgi:hypothetical protein